MERYRWIVLAAALILWAPAPVGAEQARGKVTVSYTLSRMRRIASDQYAVWIEDGEGRFVRTLFVTGFVGRRAGWRIRPQTTASWLKAADVAHTPQAEIDAVSGATQASGSYSLVWDLTDRAGRTVPAGTYRYLVEGNISWENTVLWTGTIRVGAGAASSSATAVYLPAAAEGMGRLITEVRARFEPAP